MLKKKTQKLFSLFKLKILHAIDCMKYKKKRPGKASNIEKVHIEQILNKLVKWLIFTQ